MTQPAGPRTMERGPASPLPGSTLKTDELVQEIGSHRGDLLRLARLQLRDAHLAEDVVQETLLAAFRSASSYEGRAKVKTWLVGILKFKIIDALRARSRAPTPVSDLAAELDTADLDALFDEGGTWRAKPREWEDPSHGVAQEDFERVLDGCLSKLPDHSARAFMLREMLGLATEEICGVLGVTRNNLNVLLYRGRLSLRRCLEIHWVADDRSAP